MCKHKRRRAFVLVEVLIATSLFAVLLVSIFSIFWRTSKLSDTITQKRLGLEKVLLVETRLQKLFVNTIREKEHRPYFYIEPSRQNGSPSLVFTFDNQFHIDHYYSTTVLGKLYVENQNLYLSIWPHPKKPVAPQEMRKELLLEKVANMSIELFAAPQNKEADDKQKEKGVNGPRPGQWTTVWSKEYETRPALVKITLEQLTRDEPVTLWFLLPDEIDIISFDSRRAM